MNEVLERLKKEYPNAGCALIHENAWQLLVATVLSAQSTDVGVNKVTPELFGRWPNPEALAQADLGEVEQVIRPTGFFRNKAASIVGLSDALVREHGGQVPSEMAALTALPGVGRKTAHVVRGHWFELPAITTDTHVMRVSHRLGWSTASKPRAIEDELARLFPEDEWMTMSDVLIFHGRSCCKARKPACETCIVADLCPKVGL